MRQFLADVVNGWFQRATLLVLLLAGTACGDSTGPFGPLDDARALWETGGSDTYAYQLRPLCFCGFTGNALVTVTEGVVTSVFDMEEERFLNVTEAQLYVTVDALFDILADARSQDVHSIEVEYDPVLGYPTEFFIDYSENVADEELGYTASGLTIG